MVWNHQKVYDALAKKGHYEKKSDLDKYVSFDHHKLRSFNMVLYRPDTQSYSRSPLHINKGRTSFSEDLFKKISPAIEWASKGAHGWERYRIIDWGKLAKGIGL